ncbi:MAG TPA: serpin family protein [Patescibacteria group bacterium]|nr:serpin family protein [Patescibacteria group bacterium]
MERHLAVRFVVLITAAIVATAACTAAPPSPTPLPSPTPPASEPAGDVALARVPRLTTVPQDAVAAAAAVNAFGLDLYRAIAVGTDNAVISPASVALALAMARAGARGETAEQMDAVLRRFGADELAAWPAALDAALAARSGTFRDQDGSDLEVILRIANAPFAQRGMPLEDAFLEALASRFGAGLRLVDYIAATEDARQAINAWVDEQTEQRIPELLVPGVLTPLTRLTLVNAIYLKAPWRTPFVAEATAPAPFTRLDGSVVEVPTMSTGGSLRYAAGTGWRAVELPYLGDQLALTVIVPDDLADFEAGLDAAGLEAIVAELTDRPVTLALPRFGIETKAQLASALRAMGMPVAFDPPRADFSGITAAEDLFIHEVVHQANIDVDEKGTEAAAATAVVIGVTSAPVDEPVTMLVNRPFVFALRDLETGAVLFLGRVTDPSVER